jgi:hypothetical protein
LGLIGSRDAVWDFAACHPERNRVTARQWTKCTIVAFWLAVLAANAPGHLSFDSIVQLHEARTRSYAGAHPPFMSYVMMLFDAVAPGTALFMLFMQAVFFAGLLIVVHSARHVGRWTAVIIALGCLHPFIAVYQGIIWKDVLFANLAVLAFALLFAAHRRDGGQRYAIYALSVLIAAAGGLVRQNGAIALFVLAIAVLHLEFHSSSLSARIGKVAGAGAATLAVMWLAAAGSDAVIRASANKAPGDTLGIAQVIVMRYDISGILARSDKADVAFLTRRGLDMAAVRADATRYYAADRADPLINAEQFRLELRKLTRPELRAAWARLIAENPVAYLHHRLAVFGWMIWPPEMLKCTPVHIGVDGPADLIARLDLRPGARPSDRALYAYAKIFMETPLFRHGFFLAVALALGAVLLVRHGPVASTPAVGLLAAAILFTLSWTAIGVSCDVRYMYFLPLAVLLCLVMLSILGAERAASSEGCSA